MASGTDSVDIEDPQQLLQYLRATGRIEDREEPRFRRLSGGVSNRTVLVERESGESWVLKQALERLRVEVEWYGDPDRVHREALGMRWLARLAPPGSVPEFLFEDHLHHLLAMRAVPEPHENWKSLLMQGRVDASLIEQAGALLSTIHCRSQGARDELATAFDDRASFDALRVEPYFRYAALRLPESAGFLRELIEAMEARRFTLVHGDYSPKNFLVRRGRLVLVDHETIHFGDPAFDVGFFLAHLLSKANHLVRHRERFAAAAGAYWRAYRAGLDSGSPWAADLQPVAVRQTLACLLARVTGRSTLEYLDDSSRARQQRAVCALIGDPPATVDGMVDAFVGKL